MRKDCRCAGRRSLLLYGEPGESSFLSYPLMPAPSIGSASSYRFIKRFWNKWKGDLLHWERGTEEEGAPQPVYGPAVDVQLEKALGSV